MAAPRYATFKSDVKVGPGQSLGFQTGRGYYARGGAPARPQAKIPDPLAPLSDAAISADASRVVNAQTKPILDQLKQLFANRSSDATKSISGLTQSLAGALSGYADSARRTYGDAQHDQSLVNAALSSELHGGGAQVANDLTGKLSAANLDPAFVKTLADAANATGAGSAGASYAIGSAELSKLIGEGAHAADFGAKLPGIAALTGLQSGKEFQSQLNRDLQTQTSDVTSKIPAAVAQLIADAKAREVSKAVARQSGLLSSAKAADTAAARADSTAYRDKSFKERVRHDKATETVAADKAAAAAAEKAKKTSTGKQKAFYTIRQQTFTAAEKLYKGTKAKAAAPWAKTPATTGPAITAEKAYAKLYNTYGTQLVGEYGFAKSTVDEMIRRALRTAGWQA
jgi:hypothetical protein